MNQSFTMFCPKCGTGEQSANAYCKRCGEWLPDLKTVARREFGGSSPEENARIMLFMSALSAVFSLLCGVLLYATHLGRPDTHWSVYVVAGFLMAIAAWQWSSFFIGLKLLRRLRRGRKGTGGEETGPALAGERSGAASLGAGDPEQFVGSRSVTESTTELLEPLPRRGEGGERRR